jgi:hypothetical protein
MMVHMPFGKAQPPKAQSEGEEVDIARRKFVDGEV